MWCLPRLLVHEPHTPVVGGWTSVLYVFPIHCVTVLCMCRAIFEKNYRIVCVCLSAPVRSEYFCRLINVRIRHTHGFSQLRMLAMHATN